MTTTLAFLRTPAGVRTLLTGGLVSHIVVAVACAWSPEGHLGDFHRYRELATTPGRPYVDFSAEYPPGALVVFRALNALASRPDAFDTALLGMNLIADALIIAVLAAEWGTGAATVYLWSGLPILSLLYFRFDLWPMACAVAGVALWARGRLLACVSVLCAGVALKLWPLPFGVLLLPRDVRTRRLPLLLFLVATVAGVSFWLWYGGLAGITDVLTFRRASGWDIESTVGSVWRATDPVSIRHESGAFRVGRSVPALSAALFLLTTPVALWAIARGARRGQLGHGWVAGLGIVLVGSALLSPQFIGWLLPGAAIAWVEGDRRTSKSVAAVVVLTVAYRILHTREVPALVLLRNLALVVTVGQALVRLAAQSAEQHLVLRVEPDRPPDT